MPLSSAAICLCRYGRQITGQFTTASIPYLSTVSLILRASASAEKASQIILDCLKELELTEQQTDKNIVDKELQENER